MGLTFKNAYQVMQARLIPLWLKHMATDASGKSLKGTASVLPRPLTSSSSWRPCQWQVMDPFTAVNLALPQLPRAADRGTLWLKISHLLVSLRQGTFGFKSGLGGG